MNPTRTHRDLLAALQRWDRGRLHSARGATQRSFIEAAQEDYCQQLLARALAGESGRRAPSIDELPEHVALLDRSGTIMAVYTAWKRFAMEYPCHWPTKRRWFVGRVVPLPQKKDLLIAIVAHENITGRKLLTEQ